MSFSTNKTGLQERRVLARLLETSLARKEGRCIFGADCTQMTMNGAPAGAGSRIKLPLKNSGRPFLLQEKTARILPQAWP